MRGLVARLRLALLALALGSGLGLRCGGGEGQTWVALIPDASTIGTFAPFRLDVVVNSPAPIYAFELGLQWDPERVYPVNVAPHPDFDDDGAFFTSPQFDLMAGTLDRVVDLRHGGAGANGSFKIATLQFLSLGSPGSTSIRLTSGGLAKADGSEPLVVNVVPVTITIEP